MTTITVSGPLFNAGTTRRVVDGFLDEATREVANQGLANVQLLLDRSIRNPTPYYETQIVVQRMADSRVVHDRGIVYGPWLEGTGSRNRTTRFKGYASFRRATQQLQLQAPGLVDLVWARWRGRLD